MSSFDELMEAQRNLQILMLRILPNFNKLSKAKRTPAAVRTRIDKLNDYWRTYQAQHAKLCAETDAASRMQFEYFSKDHFLLTSDSVEEITDTLTESLENLQPKSDFNFNESNGSHDSRPFAIQLPRIIPSFSGELTQWENFRDVFQSLVADRPDLSNVQKLHYLKANLKGEAGSVLSNVHVTDANYVTAWTLLRRRYDNPRAIVNAHLQAFFDIPGAKSQTAHELKVIRDRTNEMRTALLNLNRPVDSWDDLIVFTSVSKLDKLTRRDWELSLGDDIELPNFSMLETFLTSRIRALESMEQGSNPESKKSGKTVNVKAHQLSANKIQCALCKEGHLLHQCQKFLAKSIPQRMSFVRANACCYNFLRKGHFPRACKSRNVCTVCKRKHHSLIHSEEDAKVPDGNSGSSSSIASSSKASDSKTEVANEISDKVSNNQAYRSSKDSVATILPTALVVLTSRSGRSVIARALLDQGSQASFVTESIAQLIKADRRPAHVKVSGIGGKRAGAVKSIATFSVGPHNSKGFALSISALVLPLVTSYVPRTASISKDHSFLQSLALADPDVLSKKPIDLIIGADYYGSLLRDGLLSGPSGCLTAQLTSFGWIISGQTPKTTRELKDINSHCSSTEDILHDSLRRFWELEEIPTQPLLSEEEARCEAHFVSTHYRRDDGRFVVRLPFKTEFPIPIGDTEDISKRIFIATERRISKKPDLVSAYAEFMREYEQLGHMERVQLSEESTNQVVYVPHHPIFKKSDQSRKIRVVFNASCASTNGSSLNNHLMVGAKLQADLSSLMLKWRSHKYVYSTDIEKMFRQIRVHPSGTEFQRIFWKSNPNSPPLAYRLLTVTYGTTPAPFLANRVLKQLARDEANRFPLASEVLENYTYVDDIMFGAEDIVLIKKIREQLNQLLMAGGFRAHKWAGNDPRLLESIPHSDRALSPDKTLEESSSFRILGIKWSPSSDHFRIQVRVEKSSVISKRSFLSLVARIFDPLGWIAPVTVSAKIILQSLWLKKLDWDTPLTGDLLTSCLAFQNQLNDLVEVFIPRWTGEGGEPQRVEIHEFSDASNSAYAAVVYLRVESLLGSTRVSLLYSKTRVAPLKVQTVPRLELCAAVLLAKAVEFVRTSMNLTGVHVYCWTDSSVVLAWLSAVPTRWKTFVANRVSEIHSTMPGANWRHVPTTMNPADCASRSITASELVGHSLWWLGPTWLRGPVGHWPFGVTSADPGSELERRSEKHAHCSRADFEWQLPYEVSSWPRLLRITAYVQQFISRIRHPDVQSNDIFLTASEISQAKQYWIRTCQAASFPTELKHLMNNTPLNSGSSILSLNPHLDEDGILRVGGRLRRSDLTYAAKFPIILPKCRISELIVRHSHVCALHGGLQLTLRLVRQQYWILCARNSVKSCIFKCIVCARQRASLSCQRMGDLPTHRA